MAKKSSGGGNLKSIIIAIFLVALVLFYFNYLSNRTANRRTAAEKSEIEKLESYDMVADYPKTPRDVVKLHNRYMKLFYGKKLKDDELDALNKKVRQLYCSELLLLNLQENSLSNLKEDIKRVNDAGYSYKMYELPEASQVQTYTKDGREFTNLEVQILVDTKEERGYIYQEYILVKENDKWMIYGWAESKRQGQAK